ncbi:MAG: hypothetical protein AAF802_00825 [Planctomycetota bacterium]
MSQEELSSAETPETHSDNAPQDTTPENSPIDPEVAAARAAWETEASTDSEGGSPEELQAAAELAEPFIGRWNNLISMTNWEKGRIINEWRNRLIESGVDATHYSDEAWSRRVGGVTAPHIGRLRRVSERFGDQYETYDGLYWSHFLAALDWSDAPMWLEGASAEGWSISAMREKRWQSEGAVDSQRPTASQIVEVETDEDVTLPAQGDAKAREYDKDGSGIATGPSFEGPDFGDEEELQTLGGESRSGNGATTIEADVNEETPTQPFLGLPSLPDDLSEAVESLKLAILRHKTAGWRDIDQPTVEKYINAIGIMLRS